MWPFGKARKHVPQVSGPRAIPTQVAVTSALRRRPTKSHPHEMPPARGMWVRYGDNTGILTDIGHHDIATVMLVDEHGFNTAQVSVPSNVLRQAHFEEIPEKRRPHETVAVSMGYHRRPS